MPPEEVPWGLWDQCGTLSRVSQKLSSCGSACYSEPSLEAYLSIARTEPFIFWTVLSMNFILSLDILARLILQKYPFTEVFDGSQI